MKKPNILYRYNEHMHIERHHLLDHCLPRVEMQYSHGTLWRCRCNSGDHYGYAKRSEAKVEEIAVTQSIIAQRQQWLKKLTE